MNNFIIEQLEPKMLLNNIAEEVAGIIDMDLNSSKLNNITDSILQKGQKEPVIVHNGELLDGRHRCEACRRLGIKVIAKSFGSNVDRDKLVDDITIAEMMNKGLSATEKTIIAYERYVVGRKYSKAKTSKEANVRRENLSNYEEILKSGYAKEMNYIQTLKQGNAVRLPSGKYSKSISTIKNALLSFEKEQIMNENNSKQNNKIVDYSTFFAQYDFEDKVADLFWNIKQKLNIESVNDSCKLIHTLMNTLYQDKYDYENELTEESIKDICLINKIIKLDNELKLDKLKEDGKDF